MGSVIPGLQPHPFIAKLIAHARQQVWRRALKKADRFAISDINWVIMDYLVSEGYPGAAEKFAQETGLCSPADIEGIRERVRIRTAIHSGHIDEAIAMINEIDPQILDSNGYLHFRLLQLQLIEIMRPHIETPGPEGQTAKKFEPAMEFATEQLAPRAPTDPRYQSALEETMALMIYTPGKMPAAQQELLNKQLRENVAADINKAILEARGEKTEARIRELVRCRAWAEALAREVAKAELPTKLPLGLDAENQVNANGDGDAVMT